MAKFKYENREFTHVSLKDLLGAEARWLEKQVGKGLDEFTWSERAFGEVLMTLRRNGVMLSWADTDEWTVGYVTDNLVPEQREIEAAERGDRPDDGLDPHVPAEAPSRRSGGSGGRSSSTTSD